MLGHSMLTQFNSITDQWSNHSSRLCLCSQQARLLLFYLAVHSTFTINSRKFRALQWNWVSKHTNVIICTLLQALHWLLVQTRIEHKLSTFCHNVSDSTPAYLSQRLWLHPCLSVTTSLTPPLPICHNISDFTPVCLSDLTVYTPYGQLWSFADTWILFITPF